MAYKRKTLDLTNVIAVPFELIPKNRVINEVFILGLPAGVSIQLQFGQSSDPIDVSQPIGFQPTGEESNGGLYWLNPVAVPGSSVVLYAATSGLGDNPDGQGATPPPFNVRQPGFSH